MKVIVSHDVDHLYLPEHLSDGILLKYAARAVMEGIAGVLTGREMLWRLGDLFRYQWHHVDELMDFDHTHGIPSTFFFAMSRGLGLNYDYKSASPIIKRVISRGFDCGVHGMEYDDPEQIMSEYNRFKSILMQPDFGVRMHYLRMNESTLDKLSEAGYLFDSTETKFRSPYKIRNMCEFPLHIMDSHEFYSGKAWQSEKIEVIIERTKDTIVKMEVENYPYLTMLFHDRYFSSSHESYKFWYVTIIRFLIERGHSFIGFRDAVRELS